MSCFVFAVFIWLKNGSFFVRVDLLPPVTVSKHRGHWWNCQQIPTSSASASAYRGPHPRYTAPPTPPPTLPAPTEHPPAPTEHRLHTKQSVKKKAIGLIKLQPQWSGYRVSCEFERVGRTGRPRLPENLQLYLLFNKDKRVAVGIVCPQRKWT